LDTDDSAALYDNAWVKIESDSAVTPLNVGEVRRVTTYAPSTATLTTTRAFSNATTTTQTYGVYLGIPPTTTGVVKGISAFVNDILRTVNHREYVLLSLGTDMDMETSGTTNWTFSGIGATLAKTTTAGLMYLGKQGMSVQAATANDYAKQTFRVTPDSVYNVSAMVKMYAGGDDGTLQLYDETNGAEIESDTSESPEWRLLYFQATIPSTCYSASIRLITGTTGATHLAYWDNVSFLPANAHILDLPTWLSGSTAVEGVYRCPAGSSNTDDNSYAINEDAPYNVCSFGVQHDATGTMPFRLEVDPSPQLGEWLVIKVWRPYAELATDAATTDCPADLVKAGALYRIHKPTGVIPNADKAAIWAEEYKKELRKLRGEPWSQPIRVRA
jgi:hypothetical protein